MAIRRRRRRATPRRKKQKSVPLFPKMPKMEIDIPKSISQEVAGVIFALLGTLFLLSLLGNLGIVGEKTSALLITLFGVGAWILPFLFAGLSFAAFFGRKTNFNFTTLLGSFFVLFGASGVFHTWRMPSIYMSSPFLNHPEEAAGLFGVASSLLFRMSLGDIGALLLLFGFFLIGVLVAFQISLKEVGIWLWSLLTFFVPRKKKKGSRKKSAEKITILRPEFLQKEVEKGMKKALEKEREKDAFQVKRPSFPKVENPSSQKKETTPKTIPTVDASNWEPPGLDLLDPSVSEIHTKDSELKRMAEEIQKTLANFGIPVEMRTAHIGPTVTQFTLVPDEAVKLSKITNLKNELALSLSAKSVRIEAPIPGKNLVGIEIPNIERTVVHLREILDSPEFAEASGMLRLPIGRNVSGDPIVADLADMPHLLIAGATGSGKSVAMNTFLTSLLFQNSPADLRLVLVDPKRVELMPFNGIPHLLTPVITDADKALSALRWSVNEMMRRYSEFSEKGYRNIGEYNANEEEKIPKIVLVIDELADLMMRQYKKDTEAMVCRIAQMARAVGMHLLIATQRPSVDVVTGLIKANIPTRISFSVTSSIDSRTILDSIGAEDLLGKGDMLYTNPKLSRPQRIQGIYISGKETERVVNHVKLTAGDAEQIDLISEENAAPNAHGGGFGGGGGSDDLEGAAIEVIRSTGKASASLLQRRLSVGYARAARILDILEEKGMIGPARGAKPREIYL